MLSLSPPGSRMMSHPYPLPYPTSSASMTMMTRPSFILTVRHIYSNQGLPGFFRGLAPCILRAFPVNACAFFVYEGLMRGLGAEQVTLLARHVP